MADSIKIGSLDISAFKVGAADCSIYLGTTKLYPQGEPPTPTSYKYKLTLSDSTVVTAECDGTSAITKAEISAYTPSIVGVEFGDCFNSIASYAFSGNTGLTSITFTNDTPPSIGTDVFGYPVPSGLEILVPSATTTEYKDALRYYGRWTKADAPELQTNKIVITFRSGSPLSYTGKCNYDSTLRWYDGCPESQSWTNNLFTAVIGDCVTTLAENLFNGSKYMTSVQLGSNIETINASAFYNCASLGTITLPNTLTTIGGNAFYGCIGLTTIDIPNSVISIDSSAFSFCSGLTSITLSDSITTIESDLFYKCSSLQTISVPSGVTSIKSSAFNGCSSLSSITFNSLTPPTLGYNVFNNTNNCILYVPAESVDTYKSATNWSAYKNRITAIT